LYHHPHHTALMNHSRTQSYPYLLADVYLLHLLAEILYEDFLEGGTYQRHEQGRCQEKITGISPLCLYAMARRRNVFTKQLSPYQTMHFSGLHIYDI
jgi:hypothetical protein